MSSFPACQVCQQQLSLKDPAPFLLPCLHAVCETCVTSAAGGVISCSRCQKDVNLTETTLQKDAIREKEILHLTVQHNPELVLCTHEDDGNQAICWCKECEDFLCEHCQNVHDSFKITKQHTIYDVGELELGNLIEDRYCTVHPKFIADTWDTNCCMLTCRKCRLGDHSGHEAVDIEEAAQSARREVASVQEQVQSFADQHKANSIATTEDLKKAAKSSRILPENISHTFHSLKTLIDQREVELRIAHQQHKEAVERCLHEHKHSSDICHQRCQTTSDYINKTLKYASMHDIVELRPLLEVKSKECRSSAPSEDYNSLPLPVFNTEGLGKIKSNLGKFGAITTDDDFLETKTEDIGQTEHSVEETEQFEEELKQGRTSGNKLPRNNKEVKTGFAGFIYWMRSVDKRLVMFIATAAVAIILSALIQQISDYETQTEIMTQKLRQMKKSEENLIKEKEEIAREFDSMRMNILDQSYLLNRPRVEFSRTRYNADMVHINEDGELINKPQPNPPHSGQRLKNYYGTISNAPLSQSGSPQYWEVKARVDIIKSLDNTYLLLEIGLATERERDQYYCIHGLHSYRLTVSHYTGHSSFCREVWRHGKRLLSLPDTVENIPGTSATLHYGVVYDSIRQRVAFLDLKDEIIIGKIDDVDSSVVLWPMFGVYNPHWVTVTMSLVVGNDIDMSESKRNLIMKSLS